MPENQFDRSKKTAGSTIMPKIKRKTVGGRYIPRIILGFIVVIFFHNSLFSTLSFGSNEAKMYNYEHMVQYSAGKLFILVLGIWLIYSGFKKRGELKNKLLSDASLIKK